ncbi:hypothetical protein [Actinoplanes sp. HUAS TT8]|uniref:hypothetical protein n=1 Tax=Actinoplanes sp. HUAS TT8 TaxID=3447453 RepID=UPI003F520D57
MAGLVERLSTRSWDPPRAIDLCRAFMDEWMGGLGSDDGYSEVELSAAEESLGFRIPPLLRQFYGLLGKREDVLSLQDPVAGPRDLYLDGPDILVIRGENQGSALWGVPFGDEPDPAVQWYDGSAGSSARWREYGQPLSAFLLEAIITEGMFSESVETVFCFLDTESSQALKDRLPPLSIPSHVFWPLPDGDPVQWFGIDGVLVRLDCTPGAWAVGQNPEVLVDLLERVPAEWEHFDF